MVMMFIEEKDLPVDLAAVCEYYSEAGPLALNGKPLFTSARMIIKSDLDQLRLLVAQYEEAIKEWK